MSKPTEPLKGWLKKQGVKGLVKSYKKRWFEQAENLLYYYKDPTSTEKLGFVSLDKVTDVSVSSGVKCGLEITTPGRTYMLCGLNEADKVKWFDGLRAWMNYYEQKAATASEKSTSTKQKEASTSSQPLARLYSASTSEQKLEQAAKFEALERELELSRKRVAHLEEKLLNETLTKKALLVSSDDEVLFWKALATEGDNLKGVKEYLLTKKELFSVPRPQEQPLHFAIIKGKLELVKTLVEAGALVNQRDGFRRTPLHLAITQRTLCKEKDQNQIITFLLENGADPSLGDGFDGISPLLAAICDQNLTIATTLISKYKANVNSTDTRLMWPCLHWATSTGNLKMVKLLLQNEAKFLSVEGTTPLTIAREEGFTELIAVLEKYDTGA